MNSTIAPANVTLSQYSVAVNLPAPAGFALDSRVFIECGGLYWAGPVASTADRRLSVVFEWDPSTGATADLDLLPGDRYTVEQMRELHAALGAAVDALRPSTQKG